MKIDRKHLSRIRERFDALVFDLDGTLVETAPDLRAALNHTLTGIGLPPLTLSEVRAMVGDGARALLQKGLDKHDTAPDLEPLFDAFLAYYGRNLSRESFVFPGLLPIIEALAGHGVKFAVCTNKPVSLSRRLLGELGIEGHFPVVLGGDSLPVRKPDPAHLEGTLDALGVAPERAVMIGDSSNDVATARGAGVPVIVVSFGYTTTPARALGADLVIDHFDELPAALAELA